MLYRGAIGALIGARVAYAVNHWSDYADDPLSVLAVWESGISLFGGIFGGVLAAVPVMHRERLSFWRLMDAAAPGLALGILIGRSEAHTSELQSLMRNSYAVFCLKTKNNTT